MTNILINILIKNVGLCLRVDWAMGSIMRSVKLEPLLYHDIAGRLK